MKKLIIGFLVLSLLLSIVVTACAPASITTQPATTTPPTTAAKVIELKYSTWGAPGSAVDQVTQKHWKDIENLSGGRIKITLYYGGSLLAYADQYRGLQSGVADLGPYVIGGVPGIHQLNQYVQLPAMAYTNIEQANNIYKELSKKFPQLEQEIENLVILDHKFQPGYQLHMTKRKVVKPEDLKGAKISGGMNLAQEIRSVNCEMITLGPGDYYMSLEKGLIEGVLAHWPAADAFKVIELSKYHTEFGAGGLGMGLGFNVMNKNSWNKLTPDLQKLFMDTRAKFELDVMAIDSKYCVDKKKQAIDLGHTVIETNTEEIKAWQTLVKPAIDRWIKACEDKGVPGRQLYDELQRLIKEVK